VKVYGHPMSTCTRKVLTTLAEKGHEAEFVIVDIMKGEQKLPEALARQPFGVIPALEDDEFVLYESRAIMRYLDEKLDGPKLIPTEPRARASMEQWLSVEQSYMSPKAMVIIMNNMFGPMMGKTPDTEAVNKAKESLSTTLDIADKGLARQDFFGGKTFSIADISWMPYVQYLFGAKEGEMITGRANLGAWWQRVSTRPSWVKVTA
jgi:glutathione S-transferase